MHDAGSYAEVVYDLDAAGRALSLKYAWHSWDGSAYQSSEKRRYEADYGAWGLKSAARTYANGSLDSAKTQTFAYDPQMDYLASSTGPGGGAWTVDAAGNRSNAGYSYDALNRMVGSPFGAYQHDAAGNRTWEDYGSQSAAVKHTWDSLNRMTALQGVSAGASYRYRADGMRVSKREGITLGVNITEETVSGCYDLYATDRPTTRYYHDGQSGYEEDYTRKVNSVDTVDVGRYGLGPRGIESQRVYSGAVGSALAQAALGFPVYDTHGNNVAMFALDGSVAHERTYGPWGDVVSSTGSPPLQGYCANLGHRQDAESTLIYMRARYYEPTTGRFVSEDPERDGANWYVYCANEPVGFVDASGRALQWYHALSGGLLAFGQLLVWIGSVEIASAHHRWALERGWNTATLGSWMIAVGMVFTDGVTDAAEIALTVAGQAASAFVEHFTKRAGMAQLMGIANRAASSLAKMAIAYHIAYAFTIIGFLAWMAAEDAGG
ncbi:MAG: RHS repeat-associated core domain-containing protein [Fimbriimonadaceae bacterium]|nr:RHS repeat-associated core domain-containing protein [Fimbriimonadaceae bacterium]